jgi:hypothetical protein
MTVGLTRDSTWTLSVSAPGAERPILGVRALRYEAEGRPGALPPVTRLRVVAQGIVGARSGFDPATGQTFFAELPPGLRRVLVLDPEQRFLPAATEVEIPSRHPTRPTLGAAPAIPAEPPRRAVLLRPHPARAVPDGVTAVIGTVRDAAGRGVPLARIAIGTAFDGRPAQLVTFSAADGAFVLLLPGEPPAPTPQRRGFAVSRPTPRLAADLAADFLAALPAGPDGTPPERLFTPARAALHAPDGTPAEAPSGQVPIRPGRTTRWDIVLAD